MDRIIETRDIVLDKEQLKENLAKFAANNTLRKKSDLATYPIPRLKKNCEYISLVYTLLSEHVKMHIPIHPAGEWILDNYYLIEKSVKTLCKDLRKNKYKSLPGLQENGYARIYLVASEIVSSTDGKIKNENLIDYLTAYQSQKYFTMEEIWNIPVFLQICIIEKIRKICEKIFITQIQRYKAQNITERIIENKPDAKITIDIDGKYSFIEFMSYKLKKYGDISIPYIEALEEQVNKAGMKIQDVIKREHFDIAIKTLSMKNCITSIKQISRIDIVNIFQKINIVERILNEDPAKVYKLMDNQTKEYYRRKIIEISNQTKLSEIYISEEILKICNNKIENYKNEKELHVGYYLIDEGKEELLSKILNKKVKVKTYREKARHYILVIYFLSFLCTLLITKLFSYYAILLFIPIQNAITHIVQYILSKTKKTRLIPKLNYEKGIPKESSTICIVPTILKNKENVEQMMKKIEVYYLANKSENLFFTLLGDCTKSTKQKEKFDEEIINSGIKLTKELNDKYGEKFFFVYRKREWSKSEKSFMGWERKRGAINQFNEFLKTGINHFKVNTCEKPPKVKYVITLDSDTDLTLNSAFDLVGAMSHILNKPEIDKIKNIVTKGHAIIQPRIGLNINDGRKTIFSRLFAGNGGTDLYTNAISDVYQDNFDEGIFTGKGIYDLDVFYKVLKDRIPENTVLSHDLLEGSYLRCGLASDIVLMDGYPSNYNSYKIRKHRWIRGDVQILKWLRKDLNFLSKYKILDNIARNMNEIFVFISLVVLIIIKSKYLFFPIIIYAIPTIVKLMDNLINRKYGTIRHRLFAATFSKWTHTLYKFFVQIAIIPDIAFLELNAICKAIYRMKISHCNMLEWTTASEAEDSCKSSYMYYFKNMKCEEILAFLMILYVITNYNQYNRLNLIFLISFTVLWNMSSVLMWTLGKKVERRNKVNKREEDYLKEVAKKTWEYFKANLINNLPADNYQEDRKDKIALRTSPTNIGLAMLSAIASYDLKIESIQEVVKILNNMVNTVEKLQKWNGHLYNWYDITSLEPLQPHDISSVDSGNLIGYLYTVKQFLIEHINKDIELEDTIEKIDKIISNTDFSKLYNFENGLFSIGFSVEQNKLHDSYYDLLASEARQTSLVAIAKKDVPARHWANLGRTLTRLREHKGLVSWGGTAFEYLMPNINIPTYPSTLIDESCKLLILSDKEYSQKINLPWGISEAAYSLKDFQGNYQYKTFGIPWLGLKRGLADEVVISPYSSALALPLDTKSAINNLRRLENEGLLGKWGFYDSIDYKPKKQIVKTYMAHHQGMILTSIDNAINNNIFQKRFMKNPEIKGIEILLQENMPEDVIITKERKDKTVKIKYNGYEVCSPRAEGVNLISSNEISNMISSDGKGFTKINESIIYNEVNIYIKNIDTGKIYDTNEIIKSRKIDTQLKLTPYSSEIKIEDGNLKINTETIIVPNSKVEIKKVNITNKGINKTKLELTTYTEPILSTKRDFDAHPTFNKMFLRYEYQDSLLLVTRKARKENERPLVLATTLYSQDGNSEFEIDKEKFVSRGNNSIPDAVKYSKPFSNKTETVISPIIAFKNILSIQPGKEKQLFLINSIDYNKEEAIKEIKKYLVLDNLSRVFELSKEQNEAEIRYMGINEKDVSIYQKMIKYLLLSKQEVYNKLCKSNQVVTNLDLSNKQLWKYGISGDYPLLVLKLNEQSDYDSVKEIIKAFEYCTNKNLIIELAIISNSKINKEVFNEKMLRYLNKRGGIFVLENLKYDESRIIEARSNLLINANKGSLNVQIEELEKQEKTKEPGKEECKSLKENIEKVKDKNISPKKKNKLIQTKYKELKYENEYGSFNESGTEYWIKQTKNNRIPMAWSNIMANQIFGTVLTDSQGGFTWYVNSQTNKLTKFKNDAYMDYQSDKIEVLGYEGDEKTEYYTGFGLGYSHFIKKVNNLQQNLTVFIPKDDSIKISILQLKNESNKEKDLKIKYHLDLQMAENSDNSIIEEKYKKSLNMILARNHMNNNYLTYITSSEKIDKNKEVNIKLLAGEEKEVVFLIGAEKDEIKCLEKSTYFLSSYEKEFKNTKKYWKEKTSKILAKTPLDSFNIMQNGRLVYQTLTSRMLGRTGFYQSSGGYGFRDQLQDAIGMKWVDSNILRTQILFHAKHQFLEGDVEHWWHEDSHLGIRTRYADDLLWFVYAVEEYIDFTGDFSLLDEIVEYIEADILKEDEIDRVNYYYSSEKKGSIFEHCLKAIKMASTLGKHNLPLMKHGDWNDGMNKIGEKGKGESVWLGFFLYDILNRFIELIDHQEEKAQKQIISKDIEVETNEKGDKRLQPTRIDECKNNDYENLKNEIKETIIKLKKSLNTISWDGRWFIRAFNDKGEKIGSINSEECKIDSISQSFSVLSKAGDNDKQYIAMSSLENNLIDEENNLVKLLTPALDKVNLGYISSYARGMRENGGQYTHAAIWAMIAEAMLNKPDMVMNIYKKINPIEHTKSKDSIMKYKVEPYAIEADIYSEDNLAGRGGWTWYTGSSSWLYEAQNKYILGLHIHHGKLRINPCVPKDWKEFEVTFKWKEATYTIKYKQIGDYKVIQNTNDTQQLIINKQGIIDLEDKGKYEIKIYF